MVNLILAKTIDSKYILQKAVKDFKESNGKAKQLFIVPDRIVVSYQMMVLEALGIEGSIDIEVCSFRTLADLVLGRKAKKALNQQMETMLIRKVIEDSKGDFEYYQKSAQYPGFAQEAIRLITTLRTNRINPEQLDILIENLDSKYKSKVHDIKLMLSKYISALGDNVDYVSKLQMLKDYIHDYYTKDKEIKLGFDFPEYNVYVSEFFGFSEVELEILKELFNNSDRRNYVAIPYSKSDNSYIFPNYLKDKFENQFKNVNLEEAYKEEQLLFNEYETIQNTLFGYTAIEKAKQKSNVLEVQVASNIESEVKSMASLIKLLISNKESGIRYKDIACICCDVPTYNETIQSIFKKYEIPFFTDIKAPLMDQNLTKILLYALKVKINKNYSQADVFALIKELGETLASFDDINEFENYCLRFGIDRQFKFEKEFENEKMEQIRKKLLYFLKPLDFSEAVYVKDVIQNIRKFLDGINAKGICDKLAEEQLNNGYDVESSVTQQSYKKIMELLDQFEDANLIGSCKMGREDNISQEVLYKIIESTILSVTITTIPMYIDCVYIGDLQKSRYESKKYVFIFGANEGLFPQEVQDNSLLSMQDLNEWEDKGEISIYPSIKDANKEAKLNALMALLKAEKGVAISYPVQDMEGELLQPAKALEGLCLIAGQKEAIAIDAPSDDWTIEKYMQFVGAAKNALESLIAIRRRIKDNQLHENEVSQDVCNALYQIAIKDYGKEKVDDILKGDHIIDEDIKGDVKMLAETISPSRLESYLACPFRHYAQYVLGLKKRDEFGVNVADTGTIVHACFEAYFSQDESTYMHLDKNAIYDFVYKVVWNLINTEKDYKYLQDNDLAIVVNDLINETTLSIYTLVQKMADSKYRPYLLEARFGDKKPNDDRNTVYKPMVLDLGNGETIKLTGIIDRVDTYGDCVFIVDYKSKSKSSAKINVKDIVYGNKIQIVLYLKKVAEEEGKTPVGGFYLPLSGSVSKDAKEDKIQYVGFITDDTKVLADMQPSIYDELQAADKNYVNGKLFPMKISQSSKGVIGFTNSAGNEMYTNKDMQTILDYAQKLSIKAVKEIKAGNIKIAPYSEDDKKSHKCDYCDYKSICNIDKHPEKIRVVKGPSAKDILAKIEEEV